MLANIVEETVWQGLVQRNVTRGRGATRGAVLTAIPFAIVHVPLSWGSGETIGQSVLFVAMSTAAALLMRIAVGRIDHRTGGSLMAAGVFHASFNASGKLGGVDGWWWYAVSLAVIVTGMIVLDRARHVTDPGTTAVPAAETGTDTVVLAEAATP